MDSFASTTIRSHDGVPLTYHRHRRGAGPRPTVVFINPPDQGVWWWTDIATVLKSHYDILLLEPRGFPEAQQALSGEAASFGAQSLDVDTVLDVEQVDAAHFVGWCAGGKLMLDLYERQPKRVKSMLGLGCSVRGGRSDERANYYELVHKHPEALKYLLGMAHTFSRRDKPATLSREIKQISPIALDAAIDEVGKISFVDKYSDAGEHQSKLLQYYLTPTGLLNVLAMVASYGAVDKTALLRKLEAPLTLIHGSEDRVIPLTQADRDLFSGNPCVHFVEVPGGSHYLHVQNTGLVLDELVSNIEGGNVAAQAAGAE